MGPQGKAQFQPLNIHGQQVEQVQSFKYLGTDIDNSLSLRQHADSVYKKGQQLLHLLRKLGTFNIGKDNSCLQITQ